MPEPNAVSAITEGAAVRVSAPARLHLGFLDPGASLGRRFGSLGVALENLASVVSALPHAGVEVACACEPRARDMVDTLLRHYDLPHAVRVSVEQAIPPHAGLGSGTQLALAVGRAVCGVFGRQPPAAELGRVLGRGKRSGVGLALFEQGGLVVDAGHGSAVGVPPVVSRAPVPEAWRVVLIFDPAHRGLSGSAERAAFARLAPLAQGRAAHLCHLTLMRLVPALHEHDFDAFATAVGEIQAVIGDYFAAVQHGRFTSAAVRAAVETCAAVHGLRGIGQSSWGPTGFAFVPDAAAASAVLKTLQTRADGGLEFRICTLRNAGAEIGAAPPVAARRRAGG